ncbi:hypothetical protein N7470_002927 [Penicillium chermesinum]|nr:hypothetical protein N7470_002927 [Penicillium chermesinum]
MAGYNGRRAPNFAQYLDDLNQIPSPYDQALQQQQNQQNSFNVDQELAIFTNAEFFDFDNFGDLSLPSFDTAEEKPPSTELPDQIPPQNDMKFLDFLNGNLDNITDFNTDLNAVASSPVQMQNAPFSAVPPAPPMTAAQTVAPTSAAPVIPAVAAPKRKNTQKSAQASAEDAARSAAEEDKRRRNTAASARFRVKKKMREAALEKSLKETNDKNGVLKARVSQLELENHWLRGLIMEKNGNEEQNEESEKAISEMFKNFLASRGETSSLSESKRGVGTSA